MNLRFLSSTLNISDELQQRYCDESLTVDRSFLSTSLFEPVLDGIALGERDQEINKKITSIFTYALNASRAYLIYNFKTERSKPCDLDISDYAAYIKSAVLSDCVSHDEKKLTVTAVSSLDKTFSSVATTLQKRGVEHFILAPMFFHQEHLATLVIERETTPTSHSDQWDADTLSWVKRFVRILCPLVSMKKQRIEANTVLDHESLLRDVFTITSHTFDETKMMRQLVRALGGFFDVDCLSLVRLDSTVYSEKPLLAGISSTMASVQGYQRQSNTFFDALDCPEHTFDVLLQSLLMQPDSDQSQPYEAALEKHADVTTHCSFPLLYRGLPYGVLYFSDQQHRHFDAQERELLDTVIAQISNAFYQAELYRNAQDAYAEARLANRKKNLFMASMTHELRTPLNTIIAGSCMVGDGLLGEVNTKQEHYMRLIQRNGEHLLLMINELLDYSKIEAGKLSLTKEPVALRLCIEQAVDLMLPLMEEKGTIFSLAFENELPEYVEWDSYRIQQVITNLLSNANKFTGAGNRIAIRCGRVDLEGESFIEIDVDDEGCGIAVEDQDRIFMAFEQIDTSQMGLDEKVITGTGLGLPIAKMIVASHNGSIRVQSTLGEGSCFKVLLPVGDVKPEEEATCA